MKKLLAKAVSENIISEKQAEQLYLLYKKQSFWNMSNLIIYFGGFIAIGSVTFFITVGFMKFGYIGLIISSLTFLTVASLFIKYTQNNIAKGVLATFIIFLSPLFTYAVLGCLGWWDTPKASNYKDYYIWIDKNWIILEIVTILSSLLMLKKIKYPFLILPIAFSIWFLSMDIVEIIMGKLTWHNREVISIIFGLLVIAIAIIIDLKKIEYAFWLYIFGVLMFWGGLSLLNSNSEIGKFIYFLINLSMLVLGTAIKRKVFLVFGVLGIIGYFIHLSMLFKNSFIFPIVLGFFGLIIIQGGIKYKKNEKFIRNKILSFLPKKLKTIFNRFD